MDRPIALFELASLSPEARARLLVRSEADLAVFEERVKPIIEEVRRHGDTALRVFRGRLAKTVIGDDEYRTRSRQFDRRTQSRHPGRSG